MPTFAGRWTQSSVPLVLATNRFSIGDGITEPFKVDAEGYLPIPDKPGLGIELNREALKRFGA